MKRIILLFLMIGFSACAAPEKPTPPAPPATETILYFPETGHSVQPPFSAFFSRPGQLDLLGYPITESMTESGWTVQYFQYGRLEVHPENPIDYSITVGWLGQLSQRTQPPTVSPTRYGGRYFPESGHTLSGAFLDFFEANGDTVQFGVPISEPFLAGGQLVQDFQSVRMVWSAEKSGFPVKLTPLGEDYLLATGNVSALSPIPMPPDAITGAKPALATLPAGATARITIESTTSPSIVRVWVSLADADGRPIAGYSPQLHRAQNQPFPPTLRNGDTHRLLTVSPTETISVTVYDAAGVTVLGRATLPRR